MLAPMNNSENREREKEKQDGNRAVELSAAPLALTDSRVNVAWSCQQTDGLVLMFYSSTNGEISFWLGVWDTLPASSSGKPGAVVLT